MTVAAGDALPFPVYAGRYRVVFPLLDADGDLVTGATTPDTELSQDQGTFADATNEMTEIATNSGVYYLDLIGTETDCSCVTIIAKSATAGMKTTVLTLYPRRYPVLRSGTAQAGAAGTITLDSGASAVDDFYNGCLIQCTNNSPANVQGMTRFITDYVGSTKVATVGANWGTNPSSATTFEIYTPETSNLASYAGTAPAVTTAGTPDVNVASIAASAITATSIASNAITSAKIAADAIGASQLADNAIDAGAIAADAITAAKIADGAIDAGSIASGAITSAKFAAGAIDAAAIAADAIGSSELAASAVTEIRSLVSGTSDSGSTTTMVDSDRTEADTDYWKGALIVFTSGNIAGQSRVITAFDAATDTITFAPATTQAVATQTYEIWPTGDFLRPTTSGRTLDVSSGGEAGVDWANVGSPTTTLNLSGTTVKTATDVETDTQDIQARLPAALTAGGNMKSDVLAISGDATAADNEESFFDGTGYAGTGNTIPTVTSVTDMVSANVTQISGDSTAADNAESYFDGTGYGQIMVRTTIATLSTQTSFTLTAGSADNDAYNGCIMVIEDASTAAQKAVAVISDYVGSTKTITLLNDPAIFTMATTDIVTIIADRAIKPTVDNRTLDVSAGGEAGLDWANIGSSTTAQNLSATNIDTDQVVASVTGAVGSVTGNVGGNVTGSIGSLAAQAKADVNAEVVDTLATDTYAEPGQGAPAATTTLAAKINYIYKFLRNKVTQTSTTFSVYADDASTVDHKATTSDDGVTYTRGEIASGP